MINAPESFNLDVRIRERLLKKRVITPAIVDSHLSGLKDAESESVTLELEQPALAKPPVVVAPVVQPVQVVRSSVADLPPPPPGLIKESPTPPYTPMVIENVPRESSVNGVNLGASEAHSSATGAVEASSSEDASDDDADDADDADEVAADEAVADAGTAAEGGEPKGEAAIDDEWGG